MFWVCYPLTENLRRRGCRGDLFRGPFESREAAAAQCFEGGHVVQMDRADLPQDAVIHGVGLPALPPGVPVWAGGDDED